MNTTAKSTKWIKSFTFDNLQLIAILVLPLVIGMFKPNFLTLMNLNNIMDLSSILIITALGFSFVVETGSIDLSIEANMALCGVVMAKILQSYPNLGIVSVVAAILVGAICGFLNGVIHTHLKIPSFMTTLGMSYIANGFCTVITQGEYITYENTKLRDIVIGRLGGPEGIIPNTIIIMLLVAAIIWLLSEKKAFGRHVLAVGGDELISRDLGLNINLVKMLSFTIAGATFGLAGALLALKLGAGDSFCAIGYTFETISACVIGGISISGGIGKIYNAIMGAIIITIIRSGMVFFVVPSNVQAGVLGIIIIVTVALTLDRSKLSVIR